MLTSNVDLTPESATDHDAIMRAIGNIGTRVSRHVTCALNDALTSDDYSTTVTARARVGAIAEVLNALAAAVSTSHTHLRERELLLLSELN